MNGTEISRSGNYLNYLPGIYHADAEKGGLIGRYLKIFEKVLSGIDDGVTADQAEIEGIEQVIDRIHEFFASETTPTEFLDWLAGWAALILREDWREIPKRRLIRRIIPLYAKRGTREGLAEYLRIFVPGADVAVEENLPGIVVGAASTVGVDTFVGGLMPHFFIVTITFSGVEDIGFIQNYVAATRAVLDLEKPAHTCYLLRFSFPGIVVGTRSTVSDDTIIGSQYPIFV